VKPRPLLSAPQCGLRPNKYINFALGTRARLGATLGYASAAMPEKEFFVKDGEPNVKIVVGANAPSTMDVVSAADIAVALGTLLYTEEEVQAEAVAVKVKEDVAEDPDDIPLYSALYEDYNETTEGWDYEDLPPGAWYNAASGEYECNFNLIEGFDPDEGFDVTRYFINETDYYSVAIEDVEAIIPGDDAEAFGGEVTLEAGEEYQIIDYNINITELYVYKYSEPETDIPPKSARVRIPRGGMTVTLDFTIEASEENNRIRL